MARSYAYVTTTFRDANIKEKWSAEKAGSASSQHPDAFKYVWSLLQGLDGMQVSDPRNVPTCDHHQHGKYEPCFYGEKSSAIQLNTMT